MPNEPTGELRRHKGGVWSAVITIQGRTRKPFPIPPAFSKEKALARCRALAVFAQRMRKAGYATRIEGFLTDCSMVTDDVQWREYERAVDMMTGASGAKVAERKPGQTMPTFKTFAQRWTSGELAKLYPARIKTKATADDDEERLAKYVYGVIGGIPMDRLTLDDCERVVNAAAGTGISEASVRHVAQVIARVVKLAVFPARVIASSPLPEGFLPKVNGAQATGYLYPDEDAALLACTGNDDEQGVPLLDRLMYGWEAREGMRSSEARRLTWADVDIERGMVRLDKNKTKKPRSWTMREGSTLALQIWKEHYHPNAQPKDRVFVDAQGWTYQSTGAAERFRIHLKRAGVKRPELFEATKERLAIRVHDLRATFVTCALANGKSEPWVVRRTGHRSSAMVAKYNHAAENWEEARLGDLTPLHLAVPELAKHAPSSPLSSPLDTGSHRDPDGESTLKSRGSRVSQCRRTDSKSAIRTGVRVRIPPSAQGVSEQIEETGEGQSGDGVAMNAATPSPRTVLMQAMAVAAEAGDHATVALLAAELRALRVADVANVVDMTDRRAQGKTR